MATQAGDRRTPAPDPFGSGAPPLRARPSRLLFGVAGALLPLALAALLPATLVSRPVLTALHGVLLLFLVATSAATFAVQWYAADSGLEEALGRFVGAAFLGLAVLEGYHLLALPGMPGLSEAAIRDHAAAWWHGARGWMAVTLIGAALVPRHSTHPLLRRGPITLLALAAAAGLFAFEALTVEPGSLVLPGGGPTRARLGSELALALLCLAGVGLHAARYRRTGEVLYRRVAIALGLSAIGQGAYALSGDGLDLLGTVAHVYSAVAGWVVFDTLFAAAVLDPYRRLAHTTRELSASNQYLETLRGRIEGELAETIGRLAANVSALQELQGQLEDLLRAVSHDLRNPLQIILLQGERLLRLAEGAGREREHRAAAAVVAASRLMGGMIRDLVDAARMESGRLKLACQPVDLRAWLPDMLALSAGPLDAGRVRLALPGDLPPAWADPEKLDRVFVNLLCNALAHSGDVGEVLVTADAGPVELRVSVRDRGPGIAPEDLPHVFERFYRGPAGHQGDGLGLGLFITRLLVEAHGGSIAAESQPGQGATFTFTLPLAPAQDRVR